MDRSLKLSSGSYADVLRLLEGHEYPSLSECRQGALCSWRSPHSLLSKTSPAPGCQRGRPSALRCPLSPPPRIERRCSHQQARVSPRV
ncbi:hypothetical protein CesoFtcFv8_027351 [Champsocephalus esox]|uniref:Uncharacterized protein n=1 Tax=Champsocephalus esox TaxID=159716 RepID=A0AAN8ATP0_9TELE|nr:hypothetical protein CesoFtcFv8_027351 [Champsocephalus esox]